MARIIAVEYLTLDGVFEEPAWTQPYFDAAVGAYQGEAMQWADALLMGRVQTPYRYFPVEPHWLFPGLQFLPMGLRARGAAAVDRGVRTHRQQPAAQFARP